MLQHLLPFSAWIGSLLGVWSHSIISEISPENKLQEQMREHFTQIGFKWRQGQMTNITTGVSKIRVLLQRKDIYSNCGCWHYRLLQSNKQLPKIQNHRVLKKAIWNNLERLRALLLEREQKTFSSMPCTKRAPSSEHFHLIAHSVLSSFRKSTTLLGQKCQDLENKIFLQNQHSDHVVKL